MSTEVIRVESPFGVTVEHQLEVHQPRSERLLVILPGRGYLVSHPVLFHVGQVAWQHGWDVLPVTYGFQVGGDPGAITEALLAEEVRLATSGVLARGYREVCVVGKSMGTPLAMDLVRSVAAERRSQILLTPIGPALSPPGDVRTLAIIGTADPLYRPDLEGGAGSIEWLVLEHLDHGLVDPASWRRSVASLEAILAACEAFLEG